MSEQTNSEKETLLDSYRKSGKITAMTGIRPDEAIQKLIKGDPEKQKAFLEGAAEGEILRSKEEERSSK